MLGLAGGDLEHGVHPLPGFVEPVGHELGEHGHRRATAAGQVLIDDALVDQRIEQAIEGDVLGDEQLERIAQRQAVLDVAAQRLPGLAVEPGGLAGVQRFGAAEQQAQARQVLGDAQVVHGVVDARLGEGGAVAVAADEGVVLVGAPGGVAQRHQQVEGDLAQVGRQQVGQPAAFDEAEVGLHAVLLAGAGQGVGAVVELARVLEGVPVLHDDLGDAGVVQLLLRVPGRPVVQVLGGLDVVAALLVARSRLVAEAADQVVEGVAQRLDADRAKIDLHGFSPAGAARYAEPFLLFLSVFRL
ncbi:hypothetical protein D3C80_1247230 [compost metagenome]